ncbi:MAG TPA: HTTM domain-containing protein [Candidatus Acidoferrales bacterium]|nr:HTTM domain-containing protein [Candidatus Acidoferrales bacterium]
MLHDYFRAETVTARDLTFIPELTPALVLPYIALWLLASVTFAFGICGYGSGIILTAIVWYKLLLDQGLFSNHEYLLALWTMLLTLAIAGRDHSDRAVFANERATVPYWPVWLIKVQVSMMYMLTAIAKLLSPKFISGEVLVRELYLPWSLKTSGLMQPLALAVILGEVALALFLWHPVLRQGAVLLGAIFHTAIVFLIPKYRVELLVFSIASLAPYVLFLDLRPQSKVVIWDDRCGFCRRWISFLAKLDFLGVHRFIARREPETLKDFGNRSENSASAIQCADGTRRVFGFDALIEIMGALPLAFFVAPALKLPGIHWTGKRLYQYLAQRQIPMRGGSVLA